MMVESEAPSRGGIFINYRHQETAVWAGWLYDRLAARYAGQVFKDVDSIKLGDDFVEVITAAVGSCDVLLALIGNQWITVTDDDGRRRLDDPDDYVRVEIEAALKRNVRVIPILVGGATMPHAEELPPSLAKLVRRHALELSPERFDYDTDRLLKVLGQTLPEVRKPRTPAGLDGSSTEGRVDLWWDPPVAGSAAVVAWQVYRDGTRVGEVTEPQTHDQPAGPGSYSYTVTAVGAEGQHSAESEPSIVVVSNPPMAPAGLRGSTVEGRVDLWWDPPVAGSAAVVAWQVYRDGTHLGEVTEPQTHDQPAGPGSYSYTVTAVGAEGQHSAESEPSIVVVSNPPMAPAGLRGSSVEGRVDLWWDPPVAGSAAVVAWQVYRDGTRVGEVTEPQASDQPAGPGSYSYTVTAVGADGQHSAESEPSIVVVSNPPMAPAGLRGSTVEGRVDLRWDPPVAGAAAVVAWQVYRDGTRVGEVTEPQANDQPAGPGSYSYTVTAVGVDGQHSAESEPSIVVVPSPPMPPVRLSGSTVEGRVDLWWDRPVAGSAAVVAWQVHRDGTRVAEVTEPQANDQPPGPGSYSYTVTALGVDGQHSAESNAWVRPGHRSRWLIPALAILAAVLATAGLVVWRPWPPGGTGTVPSAVPQPVAPAAPTGLTGEVSGTKIALRWDGAPSGSAVAHWRVLQDGKDLIKEATAPEATVPNKGFHSYTVVAVGEDGQNSPESQSWHSPAAWQKLKDTGFKDSFSAAGVAAHKGKLWVVGGQNANGKRDEVRFFDPQTNMWQAGPKLPEGISHAPLVSDGDKLYLLGGLTATKEDEGVPLATVYSLDTEKPDGIWIEEVKLPARRYGGAAAWDGQRLVFAGGAASFEPNTPRPAMADIWQLRSEKWESIDAGLQPARERMAAATDGNDRIWFVGGADHVPKDVYADVDVLSGNKVSDSTAIPTAVQGAAAIWTHDSRTCVFGGSTVLPNQTAKPIAKVQCLDGTDPGWPDLLEARYNAGAAVIDHTIYVVGGSSDPTLKPADMVLALRFA